MFPIYGIRQRSAITGRVSQIIGLYRIVIITVNVNSVLIMSGREELLEAAVRELRKQLEKSNEIKNKLEKTIKSREEKIEELSKQIRLEQRNRVQSVEALEKDIQRLQRNIDDYELKFDTLILCQAACNFEHAICLHVLPQVYRQNKIGSLHQLLDYVNDPNVALPEKYVPLTPSTILSDEAKKLVRAKKFEEAKKVEEAKILQGAKERWVTLCNALGFPEAEWRDKIGKGWNSQNDIPDIMKAIAWLKDLRIPIAHPAPIHLTEVEKVIKKMNHEQLQVERDKFVIIKTFITSMRDNLTNGQLRHGNLQV